MMRAIALSVVLLGMAACSSTPSTSVSYDECQWPDFPSQQGPRWLCDQPVDGLAMQAWGSAAKSSNGPGFMQDVATSEAQGKLAKKFSTSVTTSLKRVSASEAQNGHTREVDAIARLYDDASTMTLLNVRVIRTQISPGGTMYVLAGLDKPSYDANIQNLFHDQVAQGGPEVYNKFVDDQAQAKRDLHQGE